MLRTKSNTSTLKSEKILKQVISQVENMSNLTHAGIVVQLLESSGFQEGNHELEKDFIYIKIREYITSQKARFSNMSYDLARASEGQLKKILEACKENSLTSSSHKEFS